MEQKKSYRAALYRRVSTIDQNPEMQIRDLQAHAEREGWLLVKTYQDIISGGKANRPGLNRLMADAQTRKFDCLLVGKLDRFRRSLVDCLNNIRHLEDHGVRFIALTQGLDTDQRNCSPRPGLEPQAVARLPQFQVGDALHRGGLTTPPRFALSRIWPISTRPQGGRLVPRVSYKMCASLSQNVSTV
jgi:hypothetical protein